MKRALALVLLAAVWLAAPVSCIGAGRASLSMPVRGVWMHPGFFGPEKEAAIEKMRTVENLVDLRARLLK